jgi:NAD-dependent SIR2 family protein deacetylase
MESQHLVCVGCGNTFDFTEKDQEFYKKMGFSAPRRCKDCREKRKKEREKNERDLENGEFHSAAHF